MIYAWWNFGDGKICWAGCWDVSMSDHQWNWKQQCAWCQVTERVARCDPRWATDLTVSGETVCWCPRHRIHHPVMLLLLLMMMMMMLASLPCVRCYPWPRRPRGHYNTGRRVGGGMHGRDRNTRHLLRKFHLQKCLRITKRCSKWWCEIPSAWHFLNKTFTENYTGWLTKK